MSRPPIALLTDFGTRDVYVGAMKGVIEGIAPGVRVIDLTHEVPPQDVLRGAFVLHSALPWFPPGTVHVVVVDPGVGTSRPVLCAVTRRARILAPDNGLLGRALARREVRDLRRVERRDLFHERVSDTFHGRDVFAPVAARLSAGLDPQELGPPVDPRSLDWPGPPRARRRRRGGAVELRGEVIDIDRFGNLTTSIRPPSTGRFIEARVGERVLRDLVTSYASAGRGQPLAIVGSGGWLEVAVREGSAAEVLGVGRGERVVARWEEAEGA